MVLLLSFRRWSKQVEAGGTHRAKLREVSDCTMAKFWDAKGRGATIHDLDLRRWALTASRQLNLQNFKASMSWTSRFKKAHTIVSRKITKFVSRSDVQARHRFISNFRNIWFGYF